jgi:GMP synthase (glutamine-hydrolysing)
MSKTNLIGGIDKFIAESIADVRAQAGGEPVLCALSGGVDSSVCAALAHKAVRDNLTCLFVDHGLMRKNEPEEVVSVFRDGLSIKLIHVDARERFLTRLEGVSDPERKRKIIGEEFIRVFEEEALKLGRIGFLVQGTIYPDIAESGADGKAVVKSHHNVGGLPEKIAFKGIIEPLKTLYKNEVRECGRALGLPDTMTNRQPFPGPGLGVRVLGAITADRLAVLKEADFIFREEIAAAGLDASLGQYFAAIPEQRSVGVRGGARAYGFTIILRAVHTSDFMTAGCARIPYEVLERVSERITAQCPEVSRVAYDITPKPPATIEWE